MGETQLRAVRAARGLSQAALASASGLSRQVVAAAESGRHRPSVDAALALARALEVSVEDLFAGSPDEARPILGKPVLDGAGALATRVGANLVYAPAGAALAAEGWPRPNAVMRDGHPRPLPGDDFDALGVVGCDPALALAASFLPGNGPRRVLAIAGSTTAALDALAAGTAHAALVHDRRERLPHAPPGTVRVRLARWRVGLASRPGRQRSVEELCARRTRVVQREDGASTQKAFVAAANAAHAQPPPGPRARGHLEVARRVADGAPAGVTFEPAAAALGLAFAELEEHTAEVWIGAQHRHHPAVSGLLDVLRSASFSERLALIGGYDTSATGSTIGEAA